MEVGDSGRNVIYVEKERFIQGPRRSRVASAIGHRSAGSIVYLPTELTAEYLNTDYKPYTPETLNELDDTEIEHIVLNGWLGIVNILHAKKMVTEANMIYRTCQDLAVSSTLEDKPYDEDKLYDIAIDALELIDPELHAKAKQALYIHTAEIRMLGGDQ